MAWECAAKCGYATSYPVGQSAYPLMFFLTHLLAQHKLEWQDVVSQQAQQISMEEQQQQLQQQQQQQQQFPPQHYTNGAVPPGMNMLPPELSPPVEMQQEM